MSVLKKLNKIYGVENISKCETSDIYRCLKRDSNKKIYEINYVDFANEWTQATLETYIESILNRDFYSSEGYLQWNFYYYFISDEPLISANKKLVRLIEKDEAFARKRVLAFDTFIKLQTTLISSGKNNTNHIEKDLYSTWLDELRKNKLHFVYDDDVKDFKKSTEDYINGIPSTQPDIDNLVSQDNSTKCLNQIRELRLEEYRTYPKQKTFELGQVVLGFGANATGKTSFLDAIELIVTGKCNRQGNTNAYRIGFTDENENVYSFPDKSNPYKARDGNWYKNYMTRGNNLNGNFNRFNYFTSDAAYELKRQEENPEHNLEKIIADIALGQEVNKLEEKIVGFRKRFEEYSESYLRDLSFLNVEIKKRETEIDSIQQKDTQPKELKEKLIQEMLNRAWSIESKNDESEFIQQTASQIQIVEECLRKLSIPIISLKKITRANVISELNLLIKLFNKTKNYKKILHDLKIKQREVQIEYDSLASKSVTLAKLEKYYLHPNVNDLIGLSGKIQDLGNIINDMKAIQERFNDIPLTDQFINAYSNLRIPDIAHKVEELRNKANLKQKKTEQSIQELEEGIGRLNQILTDIKSAGNEFMQLDPFASECPLCGTEFQLNQLSLAIEKTKHNLSSAHVLQNLKEEREQNRTLIVTLELEFMIIQQLKELSLFNNKYIKLELNELLDLLLSLPKEVTKFTQQMFELETKRSSFQLGSLSEEEFVRLNEIWESQTSQSFIGSDILKTRLKINETAELQKEILNEIIDDMKVVEENLLNSYTSELNDDKLISNEIFALEECVNNFNTLGLYTVIPDNKGIHEFLTDLSYVKAAHGLYKSAYFENQLANNNIIALQETIKVTLEKIDEIMPLQKRAQGAFEALDGLLQTYNKSEFLKDYINNNRKEIVDIFSQIHSPKEFKDIDIQSNRILLITENGSRTLDEISTGQRAALALSVFLSLNQKLQNGPGLILLDDPIAYVDDLNILSFLDYLRALVVNSKKQIIFVTANSDLAFLFKMKFEFLEDGRFTILKFDRKDIT